MTGMWRALVGGAALLWLLVSCRPATPTPVVLPTLTSTPSPSPTQLPRPTPLPSPLPSLTPLPSATPLPTATPPPDLSLTAGDVTLYPVPQLYIGDHVTFQVAPFVPEIVPPGDVDVHIYVNDHLVLDGHLNRPNLGGVVTGLYEWIWQAGPTAGAYTVRVELDPYDRVRVGDEDPQNNQALFTVTVAETGPDAAADWRIIQTPRANIYVVAGTAADRDGDWLAHQVEESISRASVALGVEATQPIEVYFIQRTIGQGGYAGSAMVITYSDRNYSGGGLSEVLTHETIHLLDNALEPSDHFRFWTEGLAVWGVGGHYKVESLDQRAAALLLEIDQYIPLAGLIDDFYPAQHEIGYLEAGALINYLVTQYGRERFFSFFGNLRYVSGQSLSYATDQALQTHYGKTLDQVEQEWHVYLRSQARDPNAAVDLLTTIRFYEVMRQYQQQYDPTAYFLFAWLPSPTALRDRNLTAELTRHPLTEVNIALETMLEAADVALRQGDYNQANALLDSVLRVLRNDGLFMEPLANSYLELVRLTAELGYEAQKIDVQGSLALVLASPPDSSELRQFHLSLDGQTWKFTR